MHVSDFDYDLPPDRIAQAPLAERDASRLLVIDRKADTITHRRFTDLPELLAGGDRLVVNDTRVLAARLLGRREGGTGVTEVLLLRPLQGRPGHPTFEALVRPARKLTPGTTVHLGASAVPVQVLRVVDDKKRIVEFPGGFAVSAFLDREGHLPLPPYIQREDNAMDRERYQTIFARNGGAVAAPTAGLHFTPSVLARLAERSVAVTPITLDVGAGTFTPILAADPRDHVMDAEYYAVSEDSAREINATRAAGDRIVAVGTTVVRTLETVGGLGPDGTAPRITPGDGWTEKFIYPPYEFQVVDVLLTNFHLPRSTLFMLVCAFGGLERMRRAYHEAVRERYRFYSYGDAMVIL